MKAQVKAAPRPLEKDVQRDVIRFFASLGFLVAATSQYRRSGMTVGLPDLFGWHLATPLDFLFEVKRPRATGPDGPYDPTRPGTWTPEPLRPEQKRFRDLVSLPGPCGSSRFYGAGGILEAHRLAVEMGFGGSQVLGVFTMNEGGRELAAAAIRRRHELAGAAFKPTATDATPF